MRILKILLSSYTSAHHACAHRISTTYLRWAAAAHIVAVATLLEHSVQRGPEELVHGGPDGEKQTLSWWWLHGCARLLPFILFLRLPRLIATFNDQMWNYICHIK